VAYIFPIQPEASAPSFVRLFITENFQTVHDSLARISPGRVLSQGLLRRKHCLSVRLR
jgi:hypothetical protein